MNTPFNPKDYKSYIRTIYIDEEDQGDENADDSSNNISCSRRSSQSRYSNQSRHSSQSRDSSQSRHSSQSRRSSCSSEKSSSAVNIATKSTDSTSAQVSAPADPTLETRIEVDTSKIIPPTNQSDQIPAQSLASTSGNSLAANETGQCSISEVILQIKFKDLTKILPFNI